VDISFYLQVGVIYLCFVYINESKLLRDEFRLQTIRKRITDIGRTYMKNLKRLTLIVTVLFMMSVSTVFGLPLLTPGAAAASNLTGAVNIEVASYLRGVNVQGLDACYTVATANPALNHIAISNEYTGSIKRGDYIKNSEKTYQYFASKGLNLFRIAFRWERLQPRLLGPLEPVYLGYIKENVAWAKKYGGKVVLDLKNDGRYNIVLNSKTVECVIDQSYDGRVRVSTTDFEDLWQKISAVFEGEPAIYAYGLMNEPHDMGSSDWKAISQAAVETIRANGDVTLISVSGDFWGNAKGWTKYNPHPWINDPSNNIVYEAHLYFDFNTSGQYTKTYNQELATDPDLANRGARWVSEFTNWCNTYHVRGYIGEFGVTTQGDPRWLVVLDNFLKALDRAHMDATCYAAGENWGSFRLSVQPTNNFTTPKPQLAILVKHTST
jgi:endoglucanase